MMTEIEMAQRKAFMVRWMREEQEAKAAARAEKAKADVEAKKADAAKVDNADTMESDRETYAASQFRHDWMAVWSRRHGAFHDTRSVPSTGRSNTSGFVDGFFDHRGKLTVKGCTESEDRDLSFLAVPFARSFASYSYRFEHYRTSKRSALKLSLGYIVDSVEATIFVKITKGSWPDGLHGQFNAFTTGIGDESVAAIDHKKIILLDSRAEKVLVNGDGEIMLSRRVVSVETTGKLRIHVKAFEASEGGENAVEDELVITPKEADISFGGLDGGFCKMEVTVAWSLISYYEYHE